MSACSAKLTYAPAYIDFFNKTFVKKDELELFDKNFITTEKVKSVRTTLSEKIDDIYNECNYDVQGTHRRRSERI